MTHIQPRVAFVFALALLASACPPPKQPEGKVVFLLFDASSSTRGEAVRKMYSDAFKRILDKVQGGDYIVADAITENPLSQSSFPINEQLPLIAPRCWYLRRSSGPHSLGLQHI